jgi:hypothetical protein
MAQLVSPTIALELSIFARGPFVPGKSSDSLSSMYGERRVACSRVAAMCCNL